MDSIDAELVEDKGVLGQNHELLECHLRVGGERRVYVAPSELELAEKLGRKPPPGAVRWFPDPFRRATDHRWSQMATDLVALQRAQASVAICGHLW